MRKMETFPEAYPACENNYARQVYKNFFYENAHTTKFKDARSVF